MNLILHPVLLTNKFNRGENLIQWTQSDRFEWSINCIYISKHSSMSMYITPYCLYNVCFVVQRVDNCYKLPALYVAYK